MATVRVVAGFSALRRLSLRSVQRTKRSITYSRHLTVSSGNRTPDKVTHSGQQWEDTDYRHLRFTDRDKLVNEQFAIDLVAEEPVVIVKGNHTWCDGGNNALGHPKVYINLDKPEINDCGYCGKRFLAEANKQLFKNEKLAYE